MEDDFFLTASIHANKFREFNIFAEENAVVLENLTLSVDNTILAIKSSVVLPYLKEEEVKEIRMGNKAMPKKFPLKTAEDLYRLLAHFVSLEDHF